LPHLTLFIYFFTCSEFPNKHFIFNNQIHWFVQFQIHTGRWTGQPLNFLLLRTSLSCFIPSVSRQVHFLDPPVSWNVFPLTSAPMANLICFLYN
jgi:hypothetical protein